MHKRQYYKNDAELGSEFWMPLGTLGIARKIAFAE